MFVRKSLCDWPSTTSIIEPKSVLVREYNTTYCVCVVTGDQFTCDMMEWEKMKESKESLWWCPFVWILDN